MYRETYAYSGGTRDPFNSLLNMAKSGPELADLQLVGIYQNLRTPSGSIAVFREKEAGSGTSCGRAIRSVVRGWCRSATAMWCS